MPKTIGANKRIIFLVSNYPEGQVCVTPKTKFILHFIKNAIQFGYYDHTCNKIITIASFSQSTDLIHKTLWL